LRVTSRGLGDVYKRQPNRDYDVLYLTGPDVVTSVVHTMNKTVPINVVSKLVSNSIVEHTCAGEWRRSSTRS
jgi:hypothetical protein